MPRAEPVEMIAFDVHATLLRWPAGRVQSVEVQQLLADYGVAISYQAFEAARAGVFAFDTPTREIEGWTDFLALLFARAGVAVSVDLLVCLTRMFETRDGMEPFPETLDVLRQVRASGRRIATFTTLPRFMLGPRGRAILEYVDDYCNCATVGALKGHPRFYERLTARWGGPPSRILCVGDDPIGDVLLPSRAGWRAVLLDRTGRPSTLPAAPIAVIRSLKDFPSLIESADLAGPNG